MDPNYSEYAEEEAASPLDLKVLVLYGLFRSKVWVVGLTSIGLLGGLLVGAAAPNEYQSEARLRYVPSERDKLTDDDLAGVSSSDRRGVAPGLADEIMLLENPLIYQRAARELGASEILEPPDPEQYDTESTAYPAKLLHRVQKRLIEHAGGGVDDASSNAQAAAWRKLKSSTKLVTVRNASTILVMVRASSAEKAQRFCSVLIEAFQERHREVFSAEARLADQQQKVLESREAYQKREKDYNDYRASCGVFDYDEDNEANQEAIREVDSLLDTREGERQRVIASIVVYEERLKEIEEFVEERIDAVYGENPSYVRLTRTLETIEDELMLLVPGSASQKSLAAQRKVLDERCEKVLAERDALEPTIEILGERTEQRKNPEYYEVRTTLLDLHSKRDGVIADIEYFKGRKGRLGQSRTLISSCQDKHFMHKMLVGQERENLTHQQEQLAKLEKLALAEMKGASALKPMWDPTLPLGKIGPSRLKPLLAGLAVGLFLGMAYAVLRQLLDRHLRYPETLERRFGLKVIGVVPEVRRLRTMTNKDNQSAA